MKIVLRLKNRLILVTDNAKYPHDEYSSTLRALVSLQFLHDFRKTHAADGSQLHMLRAIDCSCNLKHHSEHNVEVYAATTRMDAASRTARRAMAVPDYNGAGAGEAVDADARVAACARHGSCRSTREPLSGPCAKSLTAT